jgi:hypothetical protein
MNYKATDLEETITMFSKQDKNRFKRDNLRIVSSLDPYKWDGYDKTLVCESCNIEKDI